MNPRCWLPGVLAAALVIGSLVPAAASASRESEPVTVDRNLSVASEAVVDEQRRLENVLRRRPRISRMRLGGGRVITVWRICVLAKDISGKKRAMEAEASRLVPLKEIAHRREAGVKAFLHAHPERALPPGLYERFEALRDAYSLAVSKYNAQVSRYNAAVKRHNDVLHACKV